MDLTRLERLQLYYQLRILERLYPEEADTYSQHAEALAKGYKLHYEWLFQGMYEDEMSEEDCREVIDILDMHRALLFSFKKLQDQTGIDESKITFRGFDGNEETAQYGYAHYFIVQLGRFNELRGGQEHPDFNSHWPILPRYRRMLAEWRRFGKSFELDRTKILAITQAGDAY